MCPKGNSKNIEQIKKLDQDVKSAKVNRKRTNLVKVNTMSQEQFENFGTILQLEGNEICTNVFHIEENSGYEVEMSSVAPCSKMHLLVLHKILASPM